MAVTTPPLSKTPAGGGSGSASIVAAWAGRSAVLPALLAGFRWGTRELLIGAAALAAVDLFAGWTYLASYFGFFRIPIEGLGVSLPEVVAQGLRSVLLPLTVILVASVAGNRIRLAGIATGAYLLFVAAVALANHLFAPGAVVAQLAASSAMGGLVLALRMGYGRKPLESLVVGAIGVLLLISIPVATGTLEAARTASASTPAVRIVTGSPILPGAVPTSGQFVYGNYVLLRENDSRYWLFRLADHSVYSIARSQVLYIRY